MTSRYIFYKSNIVFDTKVNIFITFDLLNISGGWSIFLDVLEKITSWACLFGSGLKLIFDTLVLLMLKWMGLSLIKNHLLRCGGWLSLLNWIRTLAFSLLIKLPARKLEPCLVLWSFFFLRLLCIFINLSYVHVWNAVVTSKLVPLVATWNC